MSSAARYRCTTSKQSTLVSCGALCAHRGRGRQVPCAAVQGGSHPLLPSRGCHLHRSHMVSHAIWAHRNAHHHTLRLCTAAHRGTSARLATCALSVSVGKRTPQSIVGFKHHPMWACFSFRTHERVYDFALEGLYRTLAPESHSRPSCEPISPRSLLSACLAYRLFLYSLVSLLRVALALPWHGSVCACRRPTALSSPVALGSCRPCAASRLLGG